MDAPTLSVVVPCHDEEGNLPKLTAAIRDALEPLRLSYEIIITDDCSRDNSWRVIEQLATADSRIRALRFVRTYGQSAALWAGITTARGQFIVTLDADLQNDPKELPRFCESLKSFDCVCGSRVAARRQAYGFVRVLSSQIANGVRNFVSGENISDSGCNFRAFKRECVANLKFFNGMHRFLPTLIKLEGFSVTEIPVAVNPRKAGKSKYGVWNRLRVTIYDLLIVCWMKKRMIRYQVVEKVNQ